MSWDATIVKTQKTLYKILPHSDCRAFWIVADAFIRVTDDNPWLGMSWTHELGHDRFLLEMDGHETWDFTGPAFETSGKIIAAMAASPNGTVKIPK